MKGLRYIWNSFVVILPIVFIEANQLDKIARAFVFWTFILVYCSLKANNASFSESPPSDFYNNAIAFLTMTAYITAAVDVRFLHITDNIPYNPRVHSVVVYPFLVIVKVYTQYAVNLPLKSCIFTNRMRAVIINISSAGILITGQIALNSRISLIMILPAAFFCFLGLIKLLLNQEVAKATPM